jgi:hypothetical protein
MSAPQAGTIRWSLRRFTLGRGPLKRRSDRLQVLGRFLVVLAFLISPPIAVAVTTAATAHLREVAATEAAERSQTRALLLEDAEPAAAGAGVYGDDGGLTTRPVPARAVWTLPGGISREGTVVVRPGTEAGSSVRIWVDRDGDVTSAPTDTAGIAGTATAFGLFPLIGIPLAAWTLYAVLSFALDAHRERRWAEDWAAVEPVWNSRLL